MISQSIFERICSGAYNNAESISGLLKALGIIVDGIACPDCDDRLVLHLAASKAFSARYWCRRCQKRHEVRKFTPFAHLRLKAMPILQIIALFAENKGVDEIVSQTQLSSVAVQKVVKMVRNAINTLAVDSYDFLGQDSVVEIDETLIAKKRKYERGRIVQQQWLFGALERESGNFILATVEKRDSATLGSLIRAFIAEDATVYSDEWPAYMSFFGHNQYNHQTVNHSLNFVNPQNPDVHTQGIESLWKRLKEFMRRKNYSDRNKLDLYLSEFVFRAKFSSLPPKDLF